MTKKQLTNKLIGFYSAAFTDGQAMPQLSPDLMMTRIKPLVEKILAPVKTPRKQRLYLDHNGKAGQSTYITNKRALKQIRDELKKRESAGSI